MAAPRAERQRLRHHLPRAPGRVKGVRCGWRNLRLRGYSAGDSEGLWKASCGHKCRSLCWKSSRKIPLITALGS